jgi:hypothetical protein
MGRRRERSKKEGEDGPQMTQITQMGRRRERGDDWGNPGGGGKGQDTCPAQALPVFISV